MFRFPGPALLIPPFALLTAYLLLLVVDALDNLYLAYAVVPLVVLMYATGLVYLVLVPQAIWRLLRDRTVQTRSNAIATAFAAAYLYLLILLALSQFA